MSNEHVINKEMIKSKDNIEVYYDNQHKKIIINLDKNERFIQDYRYLNIDLTVVEILEKDKVDEYYFLLPNLDYINKYEELKNKKIYIIQFPEGKELSYSFGKIYNIKQYEFSHLSSTKKGSSGSPIFLENSSLVIGIHKNTNKNKPENYGNFIGPIIDSIKNNNKYDKIFYGENVFYEGDFKNGQFNGYGKLVEEDFYYIGQWSDSLRNGKGILYKEDKKIIFEGDFMNDKYHGYGKIVLNNNKIYIGNFLKGKFYGKGKLYYEDGTIEYEGDFVNDYFEGNGKYIYKDNSTYYGEFYKNFRHGKGIYYNGDKSIKYEGDFFMIYIMGMENIYMKMVIILENLIRI